jgi:hypothetical protein
MQSLINFGYREGSWLEFQSLGELKIMEKFKWAGPHLSAGPGHYDRAQAITTAHRSQSSCRHYRLNRHNM